MGWPILGTVAKIAGKALKGAGKAYKHAVPIAKDIAHASTIGGRALARSAGKTKSGKQVVKAYKKHAPGVIKYAKTNPIKSSAGVGGAISWGAYKSGKRAGKKKARKKYYSVKVK